MKTVLTEVGITAASQGVRALSGGPYRLLVPTVPTYGLFGKTASTPREFLDSDRTVRIAGSRALTCPIFTRGMAI